MKPTPVTHTSPISISYRERYLTLGSTGEGKKIQARAFYGPLVFLPVDSGIKYLSHSGNGTSACYQGTINAPNTFLVKV